MQAEVQSITRGQGWYSDSIHIKNRSTQLPQQQLKQQAESLSGTLMFQNCNKITLISLIVQIPFVKLISLDLSNNSLTSIDGLSNFNAPQLKEIRICNNFVTRIKNLRRGDWPNLKFLNLKQNKITDYQYLNQLYMRNGFQSLTIATRRQSNRNPTQDINWLAKLQPNIVYNINHYLGTRRYNYQYSDDEEMLSLCEVLEMKLKVLAKKFPHKDVFDNSNCFDLN